MARGINKVIIIGNLGADPDVRYMPNGNAVTSIRVATTEGWKDKQTGETNERTEWHRVVMFNRLGEIAGEFLSKGTKVYLEGSLRTRKWQDKTGQDRYTTEIIATEMQMLDSRNSNAGESGGYQNNNNYDNSSNSGSNFSSVSKPAAQTSALTAEPVAADDFDDDVPF